MCLTISKNSNPGLCYETHLSIETNALIAHIKILVEGSLDEAAVAAISKRNISTPPVKDVLISYRISSSSHVTYVRKEQSNNVNYSTVQIYFYKE